MTDQEALIDGAPQRPKASKLLTVCPFILGTSLQACKVTPPCWPTWCVAAWQTRFRCASSCQGKSKCGTWRAEMLTNHVKHANRTVVDAAACNVLLYAVRVAQMHSCRTGNEFCERLAFYGLSANLSIYLIEVMGLGVSMASVQVSLFTGTAYLTPLLGAWLADGYWGRFKTIMIFSMIYAVVRRQSQQRKWLLGVATCLASACAERCGRPEAVRCHQLTASANAYSMTSESVPAGHVLDGCHGLDTWLEPQATSCRQPHAVCALVWRAVHRSCRHRRHQAKRELVRGRSV